MKLQIVNPLQENRGVKTGTKRGPYKSGQYKNNPTTSKGQYGKYKYGTKPTESSDEFNAEIFFDNLDGIINSTEREALRKRITQKAERMGEDPKEVEKALKPLNLDWYTSAPSKAEFGDYWINIPNKTKLELAKDILARFPEVEKTQKKDSDGTRIYFNLPSDAIFNESYKYKKRNGLLESYQRNYSTEYEKAMFKEGFIESKILPLNKIVSNIYKNRVIENKYPNINYSKAIEAIKAGYNEGKKQSNKKTQPQVDDAVKSALSASFKTLSEALDSIKDVDLGDLKLNRKLKDIILPKIEQRVKINKNSESIESLIEKLR